MPTADWTASAAAEHTGRSTVGRPLPSRAARWRAVQLAAAVAVTVAFILLSGIYAAYPEMTPSDRWQIAVEILCGKFAGISLQVLVLHVFALPCSAPRAQRILRFFGIVLLGTFGGALVFMSPTDPPSIRLGIVESTTTGILSALFYALLTATFFVYQHAGQEKSEQASRQLQQLQREQRAARRRLVEAQLQAMQARVDPQRFFDVLDRVQRLYATDAPRAEALLDELAVFLRAALPRMRSASSTLAQELELAASYVRLQTLLGGAPAAVRITLPEALAMRAFPAGVILPLMSEAQTVAIDVDAKTDAGADDITVSLCAGCAPGPRVLAQVRETLAALYGSAAKLECLVIADRHIETRITIAHAAA